MVRLRALLTDAATLRAPATAPPTSKRVCCVLSTTLPLESFTFSNDKKSLRKRMERGYKNTLPWVGMREGGVGVTLRPCTRTLCKSL